MLLPTIAPRGQSKLLTSRSLFVLGRGKGCDCKRSMMVSACRIYKDATDLEYDVYIWSLDSSRSSILDPRCRRSCFGSTQHNIVKQEPGVLLRRIKAHTAQSPDRRQRRFPPCKSVAQKAIGAMVRICSKSLKLLLHLFPQPNFARVLKI